MKHIKILALLIPVLMTGCAGTMSGVGGSSTYACKAPEGVTCSSLSGVYANAVQDNLPGSKKNDAAPAKVALASQAPGLKVQGPKATEPLRSPQRVMRAWISAWEDTDETLHDQSYIYVVTDYGQWQTEFTRRKNVDNYRPVVAPRTFVPAATQNNAQKPTAQMEMPVLPQMATPQASAGMNDLPQ